MRTLKFLAFIGVLAILSAIAAGIYFFGRYTALPVTRRLRPRYLGAGSHPYRFD